jgi:hypothetical protein
MLAPRPHRDAIRPSRTRMTVQARAGYIFTSLTWITGWMLV